MAPSMFADDEATKAVLAGQVFQALHDQYVTLPDLTTERFARSMQQLPPGWPTGTPKGLVEEQYVDQAFAEATLEDLSEGVWIVFRDNANGYDIYVHAQLPPSGVVDMTDSGLTVEAVTSDVGMVVFGNPCQSGSGQTTCLGRGEPFEDKGNTPHVTCPGKVDGWEATGEYDQYNNPVYADIWGNKAVGCGAGTMPGTVTIVQI